MNRLIIIGNGFDIAHGLKSSFNDFISSYFSNCLNTLKKEGSYKDILIEIYHKDSVIYNLSHLNITPENVYEIINQIKKLKNIVFDFKSLLLETIFNKTSKLDWVDVEVEYFRILRITKQTNISLVRELNLQFQVLKENLIDYLILEEKKYTNSFDKNPLIDCFCEKIIKHDIVTHKLEKSILPENLYFLNFNYTKTFEEYIDKCRQIIPTEHNYIHGDLYGTNGYPIFGFGDEFNKDYLLFEEDTNKELFRHIKSFEYLQTKNFYLLTRFIDSNAFQVHIYGHSCGVSDRTLLNQIFEHENCKSIKIFYYKKDEKINDFTDKTYEISRHFKDKTILRKKLVPFDLSREMPQPKLNE